MFEDRKISKPSSRATSIVIFLSMISVSACTKPAFDRNGVTPQGTIGLDVLKVGMPESTFKAAFVTFVFDNHPAAAAGGKTQYLSRANDARGGQFIAQCLDGKCFELAEIFKAPPGSTTAKAINKEKAQEVLQRLLPADAPPQSRVDDSLLKKGKQIEIYEFGDKYAGTVHYVDANNASADQVSVYDMSADKLRDMLSNGLGGKTAKGSKQEKIKPAPDAAPSSPTETESK